MTTWTQAVGVHPPADPAVIALVGSASQIALGQPDDSGYLGYERVRELDVYRVPSANIRLLAAIPEPKATFIGFEWGVGDQESWNGRAERLQKVWPATKLVIVATGWAEFASRTAAVAVDDKVDTCHQYLRSLALSLNAPLIYDTAETDWHAVAAFVLGLGAPPATQFDEGETLLLSTSDLRSRILATDPQFDFSTPPGSIKLPQLERNAATAAEVAAAATATAADKDSDDDADQFPDLDSILRKVNAQGGKLPAQPRIPDISELAEFSDETMGDGKQTISDFFEYLVYKSAT